MARHVERKLESLKPEDEDLEFNGQFWGLSDLASSDNRVQRPVKRLLNISKMLSRKITRSILKSILVSHKRTVARVQVDEC